MLAPPVAAYTQATEPVWVVTETSLLEFVSRVPLTLLWNVGEPAPVARILGKILMTYRLPDTRPLCAIVVATVFVAPFTRTHGWAAVGEPDANEQVVLPPLTAVLPTV